MAIIITIIIVIAAFLLVAFIAELAQGCLSTLLGIVVICGVIALLVTFGPMLLSLALGVLGWLWAIVVWIFGLIMSLFT